MENMEKMESYQIIIFTMIEATLATVEYICSLKKYPKHEIERQTSIAQIAIHSIGTNWMMKRIEIDECHFRLNRVIKDYNGNVSNWREDNA